MNRSISMLMLLVCTSVVAGCAGGFSMREPEGFVRLSSDGGEYDTRLTNADGIVVAVREMDNEPRGNLRFWAGTVQARLGQRYQNVDAIDVRTQGGLAGKQLRWRANVEGRSWVYWTTLFVTGNTVYVVEAAGDEEIFDAHEATVSAAIRSFEPG